jgi:glycosyltransferase involved in cell wall biosynthesis
VGSHWSQTKSAGLVEPLPSNVTARFYNYLELRELYANAAFIVVPVHDVDHAAGVTTIMEGMSMGKSVIATRSLGQSDVLNDRRNHTRSNVYRRTAKSTFLQLFSPSNLSDLQTGMYVNPYQVEEMRSSINYMLENQERVRTIGQNARLVVKQIMSLDHFTERILKRVLSENYPSQAGESEDYTEDLETVGVNS